MKWRKRRMGDFLRIKHGYAFKSRFFDDEGELIVLTPGNFFEDGGFRLRPEKEKYYTGDVPEGYLLQEGDVVVAMTEQAEGLLGSSAWIPESGKFLHNQRLGLVNELDETQADKRFVYYLFNTHSVRGQIQASATGTKVRHTAPGRIENVRVTVPDAKEQVRIASILSAYDDLIENNLRRIKLLEESARLLYREWFVRLRFPGHEHTRIINGVPEGWSTCTLSEIANVNRESVGKNHQGEIEYVDISAVSPGSIDETSIMDFREAPSRARRRVQHGDVIWSCVRPNRRSHAVIMHPPENMLASTGFAILTPEHVPTSYLYLCTTTDAFVGYLSNRARGAAYPAVLAKDFEDAPLVRPEDSLLRALDDFVAPTFEQAHTLRAQSSRLRQARDLLLPKLMSGELAA